MSRQHITDSHVYLCIYVVHNMNIGVYLCQVALSLNHSGLRNLLMNKSHTVLSAASLLWGCLLICLCICHSSLCPTLPQCGSVISVVWPHWQHLKLSVTSVMSGADSVCLSSITRMAKLVFLPNEILPLIFSLSLFFLQCPVVGADCIWLTWEAARRCFVRVGMQEEVCVCLSLLWEMSYWLWPTEPNTFHTGKKM